MINYILHVSLLLGLGFVLYQVLLKKETFYSLNRLILIGYLGLAFAIPTIHIPENWSFRTSEPQIAKVESKSDITINNTAIDNTAEQVNTNNETSATNEITNINTDKPNSILSSEKEEIATTAPAWNIDWRSALKWTYLVGLGIFLINFLVQFSILIYYRLKYPTLKDGKMTIVEMQGDKAPFSFLNMIYINPTKYDYDTYEQILAHEKIHITKWHSADIFLSELALIFQWFNPFAWYYRKAVEHNLEYLTDQEMLASGANAEVYQMNLLKVSVPELPLALSTNYNQSFLKKRIQMMNAKKSSAQSTWKYLFILPILGLSITFMNPTFSTAQITASEEPMAIAEPIVDQEINPAVQPQTPVIQNSPSVDTKINLSKSTPQSLDVNTNHTIDVNINPINVINPKVNLVIEPTEGGTTIEINDSSGRNIIRSSDEDIEHKGIWEAEIDGNKVCFFIKKGGIGKNYFWSSTECMKTSDFSPRIQKNSEGEFTLVRDAGTMVLKGEFEGNSGNGRYNFTPDASYLTFIKNQGYKIKEKKLIHFFLSDINKDYFKFLKDEGYTKLDGDELIAMAVHGVDEEYIKDMNGEFQKVNYGKPSVDELVSMKIHNVDMEYVKSFGKELYEDLTVDQIVSAAIHNVDPSFISEFKGMGYDDLSFDNLISAAIHNVDVDYVKELKSAGFSDISFDDLISASIHNVDPDYIKKIKDAGFKNLDFDDMISASIHNVDTDYIEAFESAGFENVDFDDLVSASIHNVDVKFIESFQSAGFEDFDFDDMISAAIHNVDVDYLKEAKSYGFDLTFDQLVSASIHNVDLDYIEVFSKSGINDLDFDDMITAAIHNIDPDDIAEFQNLGFDNLSFDNLVSASIHNIKPRYIKKIMDAGITDLEFDDVISFGIHSIDVDDITGLNEMGLKLTADEMITAGIHNVTPRFVKKMNDKGYKNLSFEEYVKLKIHGF